MNETICWQAPATESRPSERWYVRACVCVEEDGSQRVRTSAWSARQKKAKGRDKSSKTTQLPQPVVVVVAVAAAVVVVVVVAAAVLVAVAVVVVLSEGNACKTWSLLSARRRCAGSSGPRLSVTDAQQAGLNGGALHEGVEHPGVLRPDAPVPPGPDRDERGASVPHSHLRTFAVFAVFTSAFASAFSSLGSTKKGTTSTTVD
jgi:hypothetical protein